MSHGEAGKGDRPRPSDRKKYSEGWDRAFGGKSMSERGSFCTEYIYCSACFEALKDILIDDKKYLCSTVVHGGADNSKFQPIIAGKIGALHPGGEVTDFMFDYGDKIAARICHSIRMVVLADNGGTEIFTIIPDEDKADG